MSKLFGGGGAKKQAPPEPPPEPPPPPAPPAPGEDASAASEAAEAKARDELLARQSKGRASTILTSQSGVTEDAKLGSVTLLGRKRK